MESETEGGDFVPALISALAERAARDRLQHSRRRESTTNVGVETRVSNVERARDQAADQNSFQSASIGDCQII